MENEEKPSTVPSAVPSAVPPASEEVKTERISEGKKELNTWELRKELEECQRVKEVYLAGWQRERADFLNYKKEEMERGGDVLKYANEGLILKILPILDNFEIIEKKMPENLKEDKNVKGLLLLKNQILDFLKSQGVEEIKSMGEKFDPNFHEAVEEVESSFAKSAEDKKKESGIIIEEIQKGYKITGKLLRPAKVMITK